MTRIFISSAQENVHCAGTLRTGLEAQGYTILHETPLPGLISTTSAHNVEMALLGSAVVVLVWSQHAAQATEVERHLLLAQTLKKPIFPVPLDGTSLPGTLVSATPLTIQVDCTNTVAALLALPSFPPAHSTDALITLLEQATHEFIRERKAAIEQAATLLTRGEHREEVLALLTYLAKNDPIMGVREKAQEVLDAEAQKTAPAPPAFRPADAQYIFGVRCKNGHVSYFDKRVVCVARRPVPRLIDPVEKPLDELHLSCDTCGEEIVAHVDCEGY